MSKNKRKATVRNFDLEKQIQNAIEKGWSDQWLKSKEKNILAQGGDITEPAKNSYLVYKCVQIISQNFPQAPFIIHNRGTGDPLPLDDQIYRIFKKPNEYASEFDLWANTSMFFTLYGEAFWFVNPSLGGMSGNRQIGPAEIIVVDPRGMKGVFNKEHLLVGWKFADKLELPLDEVIHFKNSNSTNPWRGLSPLDSIKTEVNADWKAGKFQEAFFTNGAIPSAVLTLDKEDQSTNAELKKLGRQFDSRHKGYDNAHKTAVLKGGMKLDILGLSQQEMDFISSRTFTRDLILSVFGVPKTMAGFTEGINRSTAETQKRIFWTETMKPQFLRVQSRLNTNFFPVYFPDYFGRFDFTKIEELQRNYVDDIKASKDLFTMGFSRNELNSRFNLGFDEDDEGDRQYISYNLVPLEAVDLNVPIRDLDPDENSDDKGIDVKERFSKVITGEVSKISQIFVPVYKNYFYQQRSKILKKLYSLKDKTLEFSTLIDRLSIFDKENIRFVKSITPYMRDAVETGQTVGIEAAGSKIEDLVFNKQLLIDKINEILGVNKTVFNKISNQMQEGIDKGENIEDLSDRIKDIYNTIRTTSYKLVKNRLNSILMEASLDEMHKSVE